MRDWFAAFAGSDRPKPWATRATGATAGEMGKKSIACPPPWRVAQVESGRATGATAPSCAGVVRGVVARVARVAPSWATTSKAREALANQAFTHSVAPVARVAHENQLGSPDSADATDWRELFEERAGIRQHDAGFQSSIAERLAWGELIERWSEGHPMSLSSEVCAACNQPLETVFLELPDTARVHRDGDYRCLIAYGEMRKRRAVTALAALGLTPPPGWQA